MSLVDVVSQWNLNSMLPVAWIVDDCLPTRFSVTSMKCLSTFRVLSSSITSRSSALFYRTVDMRKNGEGKKRGDEISGEIYHVFLVYASVALAEPLFFCHMSFVARMELLPVAVAALWVSIFSVDWDLRFSQELRMLGCKEKWCSHRPGIMLSQWEEGITLRCVLKKVAHGNSGIGVNDKVVCRLKRRNILLNQVRKPERWIYYAEFELKIPYSDSF